MSFSRYAGEAVGRIGWEQDRTRKASSRAEVAEREAEKLRRELHAAAEQSYPRDDDGIGNLLRG